MKLPPTLVRRVLFTPTLFSITLVLTCVLVPALLVATLGSLLMHGRHRALRLLRFALCWTRLELAAVARLTLIWLRSGLGGRVRRERFWDSTYSVIRVYAAGLYAAAERYLNLQITVAADPLPPEAGRRPVIVLSRHAGPGDSLLLVHQLLTVYGRRPRVVMKAFLQLDPFIDIAAHRVPNLFLQAPGEGMTDEIARLATGLSPADALLIFPEGGNYTPRRRRRAIRRLLRLRHRREAVRAAHMHAVMPPRPGGTLAAIDAAPDADVVFVAHTGLDHIRTVADAWRNLPLTTVAQARWWRVPREQIPVGRQAQTDWLYSQWEKINAWIEETREAPVTR